MAREEKVEYRDEHGNLLNEDQVKELEGKVSFSTRYETRTRVVDADGNEVYEGEAVAPPHPDVEGRNPETAEKGEAKANEQPPTVGAAEDMQKEKSIEGKDKGKPRPASEAKAATK